MKKPRIQKHFYRDRRLPEPVAEYAPQHSAELRQLITQPRDGPPRLLVGGGEHLRQAALGGPRFAAIRTTECNHILSLDPTSKIVRVEAGITWGALQDTLAQHALTLDRYRLYPRKATVGGLLARRSPAAKPLFTGDLRDGCVAISAVSPALGDYRYLKAPRKASGPDLRHLFIGGEGSLGAILDVALCVWEPLAARLYRWRADDIAAAVSLRRSIEACQLRPSWCHWKRSSRTFLAAVHAPSPLQDQLKRRSKQRWGHDLTIEDDDAASAARKRLETYLLDRRSAKYADRVVEVTLDLSALEQHIGALDHTIADVEVIGWSKHHATAYLVGASTMTADSLPSSLRRAALGVRALTGRTPALWPEWAQTLKARLDPTGHLAIGP